MKTVIAGLVVMLAGATISVSAQAEGQAATGPSSSHNEMSPAYVPERLPKMTNECGFGDVYDWKALNDYTLIVWFNNHDNRNARVVELEQPCPGLRFHDTIAFKTRDRFQVCSYGGDSIIVNGQRCAIGRIRAYDPLKDKPAAKAGKAGKNTDKNPSKNAGGKPAAAAAKAP